MLPPLCWRNAAALSRGRRLIIVFACRDISTLPRSFTFQARQSWCLLPPVVVSLPFKLIFFVLVDGWSLVAGSLVQSYGG